MVITHTFDFEAKPVFGKLTAFNIRADVIISVTAEIEQTWDDDDGEGTAVSIKKELATFDLFLGETRINDAEFKKEGECPFRWWIEIAVDKLTLKDLNIDEADLLEELETPRVD